MQRKPIARGRQLEQSKPDRKKRIMLVVLVIVLLTATAAWAMWSREDPALAAIRAMRDQIETEGLSREQRRERFDQLRAEYEKLTPEQQAILRDERRRSWEEREDKEMKEFFAMSREQQIAELDKRIDRMQEWRKRREKDGNKGRGGRSRGGRGSQSFGRGSNGQSQAVDRRTDSLDRRSADSRGQRSEYFRAMVGRMRERGIQGPGFRGPGRG